MAKKGVATKDVAPIETNEVLGALDQIVQRMGEMEDKINSRLDNAGKAVGSLIKRVEAIEKPPELKTRVVHQQAQTVPQAPAGTPASQQVADNGENIKTSTCYRVDVTKVRSQNFRHCWKLLLRIRGYNRPVTIIGWNGPQELVEMMAEVWPSVTLDVFDEGLFTQRYAERLAEDPQAQPPIIYSVDLHFKVEWFKTRPNVYGHTYVQANRVYPIYPMTE
jgi:hypothetical protein